MELHGLMEALQQTVQQSSSKQQRRERQQELQQAVTDVIERHEQTGVQRRPRDDGDREDSVSDVTDDKVALTGRQQARP